MSNYRRARGHARCGNCAFYWGHECLLSGEPAETNYVCDYGIDAHEIPSAVPALRGYRKGMESVEKLESVKATVFEGVSLKTWSDFISALRALGKPTREQVAEIVEKVFGPGKIQGFAVFSSPHQRDQWKQRKRREVGLVTLDYGYGSSLEKSAEPVWLSPKDIVGVSADGAHMMVKAWIPAYRGKT